MKSSDPGQVLHDRATRGLPLTAEEQAQLTDWYAALDRDEAASSANHVYHSAAELRAEIAVAAHRLLLTAKHIDELIAQNDALRGELATLRTVFAVQ
jgi:hypothetical protein